MKCCFSAWTWVILSKIELQAATQVFCLPLTLHYIWEKVTGNRCSHNSRAVSQRGQPGLSMAAVEEASLLSGSGKGCLGSQLTAGIWRASKRGSHLLQFSRSGSLGQERGLRFKERVWGVNGEEDRGLFWVFRKIPRESKRQSERERMCVYYFRKRTTYVRGNFKRIYRRNGEGKERQNEGGEGGRSTSRLTH